jgi:hypothetical protein
MLMCLEQRSGKDMSRAVKREITQVLQEGHGADKGVAVADSCCFFDFEDCELINLHGCNVRSLLLHDVTRRAMHPAPVVRFFASRR